MMFLEQTRLPCTWPSAFPPQEGRVLTFSPPHAPTPPPSCHLTHCLGILTAAAPTAKYFRSHYSHLPISKKPDWDAVMSRHFWEKGRRTCVSLFGGQLANFELFTFPLGWNEERSGPVSFIQESIPVLCRPSCNQPWPIGQGRDKQLSKKKSHQYVPWLLTLCLIESTLFIIRSNRRKQKLVSSFLKIRVLLDLNRPWRSKGYIMCYIT